MGQRCLQSEISIPLILMNHSLSHSFALSHSLSFLSRALLSICLTAYLSVSLYIYILSLSRSLVSPHRSHLLGLYEVPWESVEDEPLAALHTLQIVRHDTRHDLVVNQRTAVHRALRLHTHRRLVAHSGTQEVPRRQVAHAVVALEPC